MENSKKLTIEQLATLLNGKLWEKGDIKRIYLDRGYNTKKVKTTTYVFMNENNIPIVSCYVACDSQPYAWCESQKNEVIESVDRELDRIIYEFEYSERLNAHLLGNIPAEEKNAFEIETALLTINDDSDSPVWRRELDKLEKKVEDLEKAGDKGNNWILLAVDSIKDDNFIEYKRAKVLAKFADRLGIIYG